MAGEITYEGEKIPKATNGGKISKGAGWRLIATKGQRRYFVASSIASFNFGSKRIAIFSVPK